MGEIADAMLDGTLCQCCGTFLGEGGGFPASCFACGGSPASRYVPQHWRAPKPVMPPRPQPVPLTERTTSPYHIAARIEAGIPVTEQELRRLAAHVMGALSGPKRDALRQKFPKVRAAQEATDAELA